MKKFMFFAVLSGFMWCQLQAQTVNEARALFEKEQFSSSISMLLAIKDNPALAPEALYYLSRFYVLLDKGDSAVFYQKMCNAQYPQLIYTNLLNGMMALHYANNPAEAKKHFDLAAAQAKTKMPQVLIEIGKNCVEYKDTSLLGYTRLLFPKLEKVAASNPDYHLLKGDMARVKGNGGEAVNHYDVAEYYDPENLGAKMRKGILMKGVRNYSQALQFFQQVVETDSTYAPVYRELGELYFNVQQYPKAYKSYEKYLKYTINNTNAKVKYAKVLYLSKQYDKAIEQINEILKMESTYYILYRLLGYSYYEKGNYPAGIQAMETFFKHQEKDRIIQSDYEYFGRLYNKSGQDSLAALMLWKAYGMDSSDLALLDEITVLEYARKNMPAVINTLTLKIKKSAEYVLADNFRLGQAYASSKDYVMADTVFSRIIARQVNYVPALLWKARSVQGLDPDLKAGLAKPHYEKVIEVCMSDTLKYKTEIVEAYEYLGYYHVTRKDVKSAVEAFKTLLLYDPDNAKATEYLDFVRKQQKGK